MSLSMSLRSGLQMQSQVQQAAVTSILIPIESSLTNADSAPKSDSAESASTPGSGKSRGSSGAGRTTALLGSALLARVDDLVQMCLSSKAGIKEMRARLVTQHASSACITNKEELCSGHGCKEQIQ